MLHKSIHTQVNYANCKMIGYILGQWFFQLLCNLIKVDNLVPFYNISEDKPDLVIFYMFSVCTRSRFHFCKFRLYATSHRNSLYVKQCAAFTMNFHKKIVHMLLNNIIFWKGQTTMLYMCCIFSRIILLQAKLILKVK